VHAPKFYNSIRFQIIMSVVIASLVLMVLSFLWVSYYYHSQMVNSFRDYAINLNDAMEGALEGSMQAHNNDDINRMMQTLTERDDIERARLLTKDGRIFLSSSQDEVGTEFPMSDQGCQICHEHEPGERTKVVMHDLPNGDRIMRSINPIENKLSCYSTEGCHLEEPKLIGMLMLDYSMHSFMSELSENIKEIMLIFAAAGVAVFSLLYFLMNKVIFHKLAHIAEITGLVGKGDITQRIEAMGNNEISQLAASCNDVIQTLEESKKENEEQKNYLTHLINSIEDKIIVIDRQYRIVMANNAAIAGRDILMEEVIGMPCYRFSHFGAGEKCPDNLCPAAETIVTGKLVKAVHSHDDGHGGTRHMEIHSSPFLGEDGEVTQIIEVMRDITAREYLEAQLAYTEKLSTVGRIAAGMAHEINNPIAAIAACAEGLQRRTKNLDPEIAESIQDLPQYLETIKQSAYRCKSITQKMLTLSRQVEPTFRLINPNDVIKDTIALVEYEAKSEQKKIELDLAADLPYIRADGSQLGQVFLNLVQNALDAIDTSEEIKITTRKNSHSVEIIFDDEGCGIARENLQNIFEPFFTTKPPGKGTGLGLSISEGIIRGHGGTLEVSSELGIGTTFRVVLPTDAQRFAGKAEIP